MQVEVACDSFQIFDTLIRGTSHAQRAMELKSHSSAVSVGPAVAVAWSRARSTPATSSTKSESGALAYMMLLLSLDDAERVC